MITGIKLLLWLAISSQDSSVVVSKSVSEAGVMNICMIFAMSCEVLLYQQGSAW